MIRNTCNETFSHIAKFEYFSTWGIFVWMLILNIIVHIDIHTLVVCAYNSCPFEYPVMMMVCTYVHSWSFECQTCIYSMHAFYAYRKLYEHRMYFLMLHTWLKQVQFTSFLLRLRLMLVLSLGAAELGVSDLVIYLMATTEANTNEEDKTHCTAHTPANDPAIPTSELN